LVDTSSDVLSGFRFRFGLQEEAFDAGHVAALRESFPAVGDLKAGRLEKVLGTGKLESQSCRGERLSKEASRIYPRQMASGVS
jgi:hypothetical protein